MNVVYASDNYFVDILGISLISLFVNNKEEAISVFILSDGIQNDNKKLLEDIGTKYQQDVHILDVHIEDYSDVKFDIITWSKAAFNRLFIGKILSDFDLERVIYLDCDIIVNSNISELWNYPLDDATIGMAVDPLGRRHKQNVGVEENKPYYNSGVLLINFNKWNKNKCEEKLISFATQHQGSTPYVDQGLINGALKNYIKPIPLKFNLITVYCDFTYEEILA